MRKYTTPPLKDSEYINIKLMSVTLLTSHPDMSPLKEDAPINMLFMVVTPLTSHPDKSSLNDVTFLNNESMFVTPLTSQSDIFPYFVVFCSKYSFIAIRKVSFVKLVFSCTMNPARLFPKLLSIGDCSC